ncbi:MAG: hypothetical protein R3F17_05825 [Planctomycetota bacterium]
MPYEPRTIGLHCELVHPPMTPDPRVVQQLHNQMFQEAMPAYSSFAVTPMGPALSNTFPMPGRISQVLFLADQIQVREEQTALTHEGFGRRVHTLGEQYAEARGIENYQGQRVTLRAVVNPLQQRDSRRFLEQALYSGGATASPVQEAFGQSAELYGLRLAFTGTEGEDSSMGLRIESYTPDPRSLFIEVQGTFGALQPYQGMEALAGRVESVSQFLEQRVLRFIETLDRAPKA